MPSLHIKPARIAQRDRWRVMMLGNRFDDLGGAMRRDLCGLAVLVFLQGCSGGPGAPTLRTDANDGRGPLIADCHNVAVDDATDTFKLGSYLTTWGSAFGEGAAAGLVEGLGGNKAVTPWVDGILTGSRVFCKSYPASSHEVSSVVADILDQVLRPIGYPILLSDQANGMFETGEFHQMMRMARWRDRFSIDVSPDGEQRTTVRVVRVVAISRPDRGRYSDYFTGTSVGRNEAWLLNEISRRL